MNLPLSPAGCTHKVPCLETSSCLLCSVILPQMYFRSWLALAAPVHDLHRPDCCATNRQACNGYLRSPLTMARMTFAGITLHTRLVHVQGLPPFPAHNSLDDVCGAHGLCAPHTA